MRTLILSCNTGAGHNSCAKAIQEVYQSRGDVCDIYDALLFISKRASKFMAATPPSTTASTPSRSAKMPTSAMWKSITAKGPVPASGF